MITRRETLLGASLLVTPALARSSYAQSSQELRPLSELPPVPSEYVSIAGEEPMGIEFGDHITPLGTGTPSTAQSDIAKKIIAGISTPAPPVSVAAHLLEVARGTYGQEWRGYTRAWPKDAPANPLILEFFTATKSRPSGDQVAWCAAFVNWCLLKGREKRADAAILRAPTRNASSSSFRSWGADHLRFVKGSSSPVEGAFQPKLGDIVVFQEVKRDGSADPYHGHVSFFVDMDATKINCLGGNQFEGHPTTHAINLKPIPIWGARLQLHSIRRDPCLHV